MPTQDRLEKRSFFNWFYFAINWGSCIAVTVIVYIQVPGAEQPHSQRHARMRTTGMHACWPWLSTASSLDGPCGKPLQYTHVEPTERHAPTLSPILQHAALPAPCISPPP